MKDGKNLKRSMNARYNQLRKNVAALSLLTENLDPSDLAREDLADMREQVGQIGQCFHEFNAYRNALEIPLREDVKADLQTSLPPTDAGL